MVVFRTLASWQHCPLSTQSCSVDTGFSLRTGSALLSCLLCARQGCSRAESSSPQTSSLRSYQGTGGGCKVSPNSWLLGGTWRKQQGTVYPRLGCRYLLPSLPAPHPLHSQKLGTQRRPTISYKMGSRGQNQSLPKGQGRGSGISTKELAKTISLFIIPAIQPVCTSGGWVDFGKKRASGYRPFWKQSIHTAMAG